MDGLWDCDDLVALMRMLVRNRDLLDAMETGLARLGGIADARLARAAAATRAPAAAAISPRTTISATISSACSSTTT